MPITQYSIEHRLNSRFFIAPNGCWQWIGAKSLQGYGLISVNKSNKQARRLMFSLLKREIPKNERLLCLCNNKLCINPEHHCTAEDTFDLNILKGNNPNDCWIWAKGQNGMGYGIFNIKGKPTLVHRIMYERHNGPIPINMYIMHLCDNPPCLNPSHLTLGTQFDNMRDMHNKNRGNKSHGSAHRKSIINEDIAMSIKLSQKNGLSIKETRTLLNIPYVIVWQIYNNKTWRHITT